MTPLEALAKARAAWEASQPQLPLDLWGEDGELGETARGGTAVSPSPPSPRTTAELAKGGLDPGPEPRCDRGAVAPMTRGPTRSLPPAGGSGPL